MAIRTLLLVLGMGVLAAVRLAVAAEGRPPVILNIEAQPLGNALNQFAQQSGLQLVFYSKIGKGLVAPRVEGAYSPEAALEQLLANTPLGYEFINPRTVAILAKAQGRETSKVSGLSAMHMAEVSAGAGQGPMQVAEADAERRDSQSDKPASTIKSAVPEMLVKGSKVINADIQRTEDDIQPYVVFNREQIQQSQAGNLEEFFRARLPMNAAYAPNGLIPNNLGNQSTIDLRGFGAAQTLILVDGRRLPGVSNFGAQQAGELSQPDINGIPMSAIERIEVLPSTAGGIYGGSATGGVINIILRKDFSGMQFDALYGNTFASDVADRRLDLSAGYSFGTGTQIFVTASHRDGNPLLAGERDFTRRSRYLLLSNDPSAITGSFLPPSGYTSNIKNRSSGNLVLDNSTMLSSPITSVPVGYAGPTSDSGAALVANAGKYNLDLSHGPSDAVSTAMSLMTTPTVESASFDLRQKLGAHFEVFLGTRWSDNSVDGKSNGFAFANNTISLPSASPYNPFTTDVWVSFPSLLDAGDSYRSNDSKTRQFMGGVIVRLPRDWTVSVDYSWSRSSNSRKDAFLTGDPDGSGPGLDFGAALNAGLLNVTRDLNAYPLDYSPYIDPQLYFYGPYENTLRDTNLRLSGPVLNLWAGPLTLSALVEHRDEASNDAFSDEDGYITYYPRVTQAVDSYYLEGHLPIVSSGNAFPGVRTLELAASSRRDRYETRTNDLHQGIEVPSLDGPFPALTYGTNRVTSTKSTLGLRYSPVKDVVLRVSYGTGFLPPTFSQILPSTGTVGGITVIDPYRGNINQTYTSIQRTIGGNPQLLPEDSRSWSAGVIFTPHFLPRLRVSIDYTDIEKSSEIGIVGSQGLVDLEDVLGRVTRGPLESNAPAGYTRGPIIALNDSLVNFSYTNVKAYDVQLDYSVPTNKWGEFNLYTVATWEPDFKRQTLPRLPVYNSAGYYQGPLKWRGNVGAGWNYRAWALGLNAQYYDSYFLYGADFSDATIATVVRSQGSGTVPSQIYVDALASYRFGEEPGTMRGLLANTTLSLGIQNLFNKEPPILAITSPAGYSYYGDPRLRRYSVHAQKNFCQQGIEQQHLGQLGFE